MSEFFQLTNFLNHSLSKKKLKEIKIRKLLSLKPVLKQTPFSYNESCCICLENNNSSKVVTPCKHLFCNECLGRWLETNNCCPVCKSSFEN